ncbi:MAG: ATP-binding cassette domain-containing protein, partial [Betaproteobacteria bacterium]|nr:ATP-binding cassette domain-containing protein [Betaproteobacteria bacterium]
MVDRRPFLHVRDVSKTFMIGAERVDALHKIDLIVDRGEFVCLIGASGCGKSTLLRVIAGFEAPTSGDVRMYDAAITGPGSDRGMVFQDYALFPWMTVHDNIAFGPRQKGSVDAGDIAA